MNKMVSEFLKEQRDKEREAYEAEKESLLISLGLYEKVYSSNDEYSEEYSWVEWNDENSKNIYYKKVTVNVTDEEYEELKKYSNLEVKQEKSVIATILTVIAWVIYIGGFILGIVLGNNSYDSSFGLVLVYWVVFFISGTVYLAFAEVIKLLVKIKNK